jgi:hypothetical protein
MAAKHIRRADSPGWTYAGSGLTFAAAGVYELKGVPDTWQLYSAIDR